MPRTGAIAAIVAVLLAAAACGGDEDRAPADPVEDGADRAVSDIDPREGTIPATPRASEAEPSEGSEGRCGAGTAG